MRLKRFLNFKEKQISIKINLIIAQCGCSVASNLQIKLKVCKKGSAILALW